VRDLPALSKFAQVSNSSDFHTQVGILRSAIVSIEKPLGDLDRKNFHSL